MKQSFYLLKLTIMLIIVMCNSAFKVKAQLWQVTYNGTEVSVVLNLYFSQIH